MAEYPRVQSGQRINSTPVFDASFINDLRDMMVDWKRLQMGQGGSGETSRRPPVKIKNLSGSDLLRGHVVQIDRDTALLANHDPAAPWFKGALAAAQLSERLAILDGALPQDKIGDAHVSGHCCALITITDIAHTHAVAVVGEYVLQSAASGPIEILSTVDEGDDELEEPKEYWVKFAGGSSSVKLGEANGDIDVDTFGDFIVHSLSISGAPATEEVVSAYAYFRDIEDGDRAVLVQHESGLYVAITLPRTETITQSIRFDFATGQWLARTIEALVVGEPSNWFNIVDGATCEPTE